MGMSRRLMQRMYVESLHIAEMPWDELEMHAHRMLMSAQQFKEVVHIV